MAQMRTPVAAARGMGSAKEGAGVWQLQRLTAITNVILVVWFIVQVAPMSGADYAAWHAWFDSPYHATMMVLLVISVFWHVRLGVQVVLEDYIRTASTRIATMIALNLGCVGLGAACLVAILKISIGS
jgi:succinate dehydrogenase / fumarate reductase membrane anchor subunit